MAHFSELFRIMRSGTNIDRITLLGTFLITVFYDMVLGVGFGLLSSFLLTTISFFRNQNVSFAKIKSPMLLAHDNDKSYLTITGPIFFGSNENKIREIFGKSKNELEIDLSSIPYIDLSGFVFIVESLSILVSKGVKLSIVCNNSVIENLFHDFRKLYSQDFILNCTQVRTSQESGECETRILYVTKHESPIPPTVITLNAA